MSRGPLPNPNSRRRNAPTIPTTNLPAGGRKGRAPKVPEGYDLLDTGTRWWKWAWSTPQAAAWDTGALYTIARRAKLEDDLWLLERADEFDLSKLLDAGDEGQVLAYVEATIRKLKALAGGSAQILKEMRELDKRLGLDPKAMAELRWTIVAEADDAKAAKAKPKQPPRRHLQAVDTDAA